MKEVLKGSLEGIKVIDFSTLLPGPLASLFLAETGAEVIKIEPPAPDTGRSGQPYVGEMSLYFAEITGDILVLEAEARLKERGTYTVEMSNSSRKNYGAAPSAESAADGHEIL